MWRARYRGPDGREYAKHARLKREAQEWLDEATAAMRAGTWVDPATSKMTLGEWLDKWLAGYQSKRPSTLKSAQTHAAIIREQFGKRQMRTIQPSDIRAWTATLSKRYSTSYVYAIHRRLHQVLDDAVHDGLLPRNPVSRRTAPPTAAQRAYVASTEQVWALYDALKPEYRNMVLLGAFAGLRIAEIAALTRDDVDWVEGSITVTRQYGKEELKTSKASTTIPIPLDLAAMLDADAGETYIVPGVFGRGVSDYQLNREWIAARERVEGLPDGFRTHDLRHYFASLLIAAGLDIKTVQARMRHASAKVTLDTYGHLWPDRDESSRAAIAAVLETREPPERGVGVVAGRV